MSAVTVVDFNEMNTRYCERFRQINVSTFGLGRMQARAIEALVIAFDNIARAARALLDLKAELLADPVPQSLLEEVIGEFAPIESLIAGIDLERFKTDRAYAEGLHATVIMAEMNGNALLTLIGAIRTPAAARQKMLDVIAKRTEFLAGPKFPYAIVKADFIHGKGGALPLDFYQGQRCPITERDETGMTVIRPFGSDGFGYAGFFALEEALQRFDIIES